MNCTCTCLGKQHSTMATYHIIYWYCHNRYMYISGANNTLLHTCTCTCMATCILVLSQQSYRYIYIHIWGKQHSTTYMYMYGYMYTGTVTTELQVYIYTCLGKQHSYYGNNTYIPVLSQLTYMCTGTHVWANNTTMAMHSQKCDGWL